MEKLLRETRSTSAQDDSCFLHDFSPSRNDLKVILKWHIFPGQTDISRRRLAFLWEREFRHHLHSTTVRVPLKTSFGILPLKNPFTVSTIDIVSHLIDLLFVLRFYCTINPMSTLHYQTALSRLIHVFGSKWPCWGFIQEVHLSWEWVVWVGFELGFVPPCSTFRNDIISCLSDSKPTFFSFNN